MPEHVDSDGESEDESSNKKDEGGDNNNETNEEEEIVFEYDDDAVPSTPVRRFTRSQMVDRNETDEEESDESDVSTTEEVEETIETRTETRNVSAEELTKAGSGSKVFDLEHATENAALMIER